MDPSDFTTTSFGRLRRRPWKLLASTVMLPSTSLRVTRRESCSQARRRPWRSRVRPLARSVGSETEHRHVQQIKPALLTPPCRQRADDNVAEIEVLLTLVR